MHLTICFRKIVANVQGTLIRSPHSSRSRLLVHVIVFDDRGCLGSSPTIVCLPVCPLLLMSRPHHGDLISISFARSQDAPRARTETDLCCRHAGPFRFIERVNTNERDRLDRASIVAFVKCSKIYLLKSPPPWLEREGVSFPWSLSYFSAEVDDSKIVFETSQDVEVYPTFDRMRLKEDLLRGVYAYGAFFPLRS